MSEPNAQAPWEMVDTFHRDGEAKSPYDEGVYALKCPGCQNTTTKRADSLALGLHQIICITCGHTTNRVRSVSNGHEHIYEVGSEARQGGGS